MGEETIYHYPRCSKSRAGPPAGKHQKTDERMKDEG